MNDICDPQLRFEDGAFNLCKRAWLIYRKHHQETKLKCQKRTRKQQGGEGNRITMVHAKLGVDKRRDNLPAHQDDR